MSRLEIALWVAAVSLMTSLTWFVVMLFMIMIGG